MNTLIADGEKIVLSWVWGQDKDGATGVLTRADGFFVPFVELYGIGGCVPSGRYDHLAVSDLNQAVLVASLVTPYAVMDIANGAGGVPESLDALWQSGLEFKGVLPEQEQGFVP